MITRIAVLGSRTFVERLRHFEEELPTIFMDYYIYNSPKEAIHILPTIKPCDAVFFSGSLPYIYTEDVRHKLPVPSSYLKQDETTITKTLLSISYSNPVPIQQLSIDLIEPQIVQNILEDIGQAEQFPFLMKIDPTFDLPEIVAFHSNLQNSGETSLAITSIHAVYQELKVKGISVIRMIDSKSSLIQALENTKSKALLAKSQSAKIAVGYIQLYTDTLISDETIIKISNFVKSSIVKVEKNVYSFFSTQGKVQDTIANITLENLIELDASPLKIAFGYGKTVNEATRNAKDALSFTTENTVYLMTEQKELVGPFPDNQKQVTLKTNSPQLALIAKETTLSPANLSKVMQFSRAHKSIEFTAYDLEGYLQVSRRTTERILKKLVNHGYARITGEEMTYQQGRPRAIYELNFPTYL